MRCEERIREALHLWLKAHQGAKRQNATGQQHLADTADPAGSGAAGSDASGSGAGGSGPSGSGARVEVRRSALAAQALVRMMENGGGKGKANRADLVIVCDLRAYRRGHAEQGEPCHIVGGGPIPVSLARRLGQDAFLKAVLHDGVKIDTIAHFGRRVVPGERSAGLVADLFREAGDYVEVLRRLWDSWEDDAEIRDAATGRFIDRDKLHYIDFAGRFFSVKGPSITPRPPQGQPVVAALAHQALPYELVGRSADLGFVTPEHPR